MNLTDCTEDEVRLALGLRVDARGEVTLDSCVTLARRAVFRWGVATEQELRSYLYRTLAGAGLLSDVAQKRVRAGLSWLVTAREVETAMVDGTMRYLRALPLVVSCGPIGFLSGTVDAPPQHTDEEGGDGTATGPTRWLNLDAGGDDLEGLDVRTIEEWLGRPASLKHGQRRGASTLTELWARLEAAFHHGSNPVLDSSAIRVVAGTPGGFFGSAADDDVNARWRDAARTPDGLWLGARGGWADGFTNPVIARVRDGQATRAMDLFDWDEWNWALLSRGVATGGKEQLRVGSDQVAQTCPLPDQLLSVLAVAGGHDGAWRWNLRPRAADAVVKALVRLGGLEVL